MSVFKYMRYTQVSSLLLLIYYWFCCFLFSYPAQKELQQSVG